MMIQYGSGIRIMMSLTFLSVLAVSLTVGMTKGIVNRNSGISNIILTNINTKKPTTKCLISASSSSESSSSESSKNSKRKHFYSKSECEFFKDFLKHHKKTYIASKNCNDLKDERADIFKANNITINEHNKRFKEGKETYLRHISSHSDLSFEEKQKHRMGLVQKATPRNMPVRSPSLSSLSSKIDWRTGTGLSPIKDQGSKCGACWAFAAASVCDFLARRAGVTSICSEQSLIDCVSASYGCNGGMSSYILFFLSFLVFN